MYSVGQEVLYNKRYGAITALPSPEDTEKQGMVEVTLHGQDPEWVGECFVQVVTDEMRRARHSHSLVEAAILFEEYPGGRNYRDWED
jgi:hypothetical protein